MRIEEAIISNLIYNEEYCRKVAPFVRVDYFQDRVERILTREIMEFFGKYNKPPTQEILKIEINGRTDISQGDVSRPKCID